MRLYPTGSTFHLALAGAAVVSLGLASRAPVAVAYGGAMLLSLAIGRAISHLTVSRLREAGFEMVWTTARRVLRTVQGAEVLLTAELRNRSDEDMVGVEVRAIASSMLEVNVTPKILHVPARGFGRVTLHVRGRRVGRWGIHGVALEVRGALGGGETLYEAPLMFANPFGIEVLPRVGRALVSVPFGGRSRKSIESGRPARTPGDGDELRELREHAPGDPFKRIAWKASARRGKLLVRSMERNERDIVWLMVDASVDLWAGTLGEAPLDFTVEEVSSLASRHIDRGDRVGLVVCASRLRTWLAPATGTSQAQAIAAALASAASMVDDDRCDLDEQEIAQRVFEHARPLEPHAIGHLNKRDLDKLAARALSLRTRAPFAPRFPHAKNIREQTLRHYLAAFGIEVPPKADGEQERTHQTMATLLERIAREKLRPTLLHIFSTAPAPNSPLLAVLRKLRGRHIHLTWNLPRYSREAQALEMDELLKSVPADVGTAVEAAVRVRTNASRARGEQVLRGIGIRGRKAG